MVAGAGRAALDLLERRQALQHRAVRLHVAQRRQDVFADRAALARLRVDHRAVQAEAAGLEAVEGVDEVVVFLRHRLGAFEQAPADRLQVARERRGALDGQRRVAHPQLDRAVLGLGADVPVEVLHRLDDAGRFHLREVDVREVVPAQRERRAPAQREREHRVQPRRVEQRVHPLEERRRARQRDEVRHVAVQRMQQEQRVVARRAADVHVLAEHGELLGQVAVQLRQLLVARLLEHALLRPALERVRPAAGDAHVEPVAGADQRVAHAAQLGQQRRVRGLDAAGDLDHALRHLGRDRARERLAREQFQQVVGARGQVVVDRVDELQLELHAERQRLRLAERSERHQLSSGCDSPASFSARCVTSGPITSSSTSRPTITGRLSRARSKP